MSENHSIPSGLDAEEQFAFCIGHMMIEWANLETMMRGMYICTAHAGNPCQGEVVWLSIRSTRARIKLLHLAVDASALSGDDRREIQAILQRFGKLTQTRNFFAHCLYDVDPKSRKLRHFEGHEFTMDGSVHVAKTKPANHQTLNGIRQTVKQMSELNDRAYRMILALKEKCGAHDLMLPTSHPDHSS